MRIKDIVKEGTFDDFDMKDYGKEMDDDERDMGKSFEKDSMFDQLGKIIDTRRSCRVKRCVGEIFI